MIEKPPLVITLKNSPSLPGIQYLRAIAVVWVILYHTTTMSRFEKYFNINILAGLFDPGFVGVELFFVVSGFIITFVSLNRLTLKPRISAKEFFYRRFIRIVPFMWICVIGYAVLRFMSRGFFSPSPYLRAILLFPIGKVEPNVIWTLRHEFLFYIVFCLSIILTKPKWIYLIAWFLSPIIWYGLNLRSCIENSYVQNLFDFIFNRLNILFGLGFIVGILYLKGFLTLQYFTKFGFFTCLFLSIFLFLSSKYTLDKEPFDNFLHIVITGVVSSVLVLFAIIQFNKPLLNWTDKLGLLLGNASYSIYLTHSAVISFILGMWSNFQPTIPYPGLILLATLIFSCLGGVAIHLFVEKPLISILQKKTIRK